jgi:hypothetical protein
MEPIANIVFNRNGTISPDQLEGLPDEVRARLTAPEFIARAKAQIRAQLGIVKTGRRESRIVPIGMHVAPGPGPNRKMRRKYDSLHRHGVC